VRLWFSRRKGIPRLSGKIAVVTGAASGIGKAWPRVFERRAATSHSSISIGTACHTSNSTSRNPTVKPP
jgi:hypothetical protein